MGLLPCKYVKDVRLILKRKIDTGPGSARTRGWALGNLPYSTPLCPHISYCLSIVEKTLTSGKYISLFQISI